MFNELCKVVIARWCKGLKATLARGVVGVAILVFGVQAYACEGDEECAEVGRWDISVALGGGMRTNPIAGGDNLPILIIPSVSYYGKRFYLEEYTLGYSLIEKPIFTTNLVLTPSFDQAYFQSWGLGNLSFDTGAGSSSAYGDEGVITNTPAPEMEQSLSKYPSVEADEVGNPIVQPAVPSEPESERVLYTLDLKELDSRKMAVFGGVEFSYFGERWLASLNVLQDVANVHGGQEVRFAASQTFGQNKTRVQLAAGTTWQSAELLDYYFGAHESEVSQSMVYRIHDNGFTPFARVAWSYKLTERWNVLASLHHKWLSNTVVDSPLVEESGVTTAFIGGVYHF